MKKLEDMDYADQERVKVLRRVLRSLKLRKAYLERQEMSFPQTLVSTHRTRAALMGEDIEKGQAELDELMKD